MNITLGSGKAVHASYTGIDGQAQMSPACGGNRAGERYGKTAREVTCKNCLKKLAQQTEVTEPVAQAGVVVETPSKAVARTADPIARRAELEAARINLKARLTEVEAELSELDHNAVEGSWSMVEIQGARYAISPIHRAKFGAVDSVNYRRVYTDCSLGPVCRAYADESRGTVRRGIWDAAKALCNASR